MEEMEEDGILSFSVMLEETISFQLTVLRFYSFLSSEISVAHHIKNSQLLECSEFLKVSETSNVLFFFYL